MNYGLMNGSLMVDEWCIIKIFGYMILYDGQFVYGVDGWVLDGDKPGCNHQ